MERRDDGGDLLTVEEARQMTSNRKGRRIGRDRFREMVRRGIVPSWRDPLSARGEVRIPRVAMENWLATLATHDPKPPIKASPPPRVGG